MILLLHGPTGCGKTFLAREFNHTFEIVYHDDMDLAALVQMNHRIVRDAAAGMMVIVVLAAHLTKDKLRRINDEIVNEWREKMVVLVVRPSSPMNGEF